jgi:hypothetical protein
MPALLWVSVCGWYEGRRSRTNSYPGMPAIDKGKCFGLVVTYYHPTTLTTSKVGGAGLEGRLMGRNILEVIFGLINVNK